MAISDYQEFTRNAHQFAHNLLEDTGKDVAKVMENLEQLLLLENGRSARIWYAGLQVPVVSNRLFNL